MDIAAPVLRTKLTEAGRWAHGRCKLFDLAKVARPLAAEAVRRIDAIFDVQRSINGPPAEPRLALRQTHVAPLVTDLETWMRGARGTMSRHVEVAQGHGPHAPTLGYVQPVPR